VNAVLSLIRKFVRDAARARIAASVMLAAGEAGLSAGAVISATSSSTTVFLAGVEQTTAISAQIDLYNVTLGRNTPRSDTFQVASPATLAVTNSANENKPDIYRRKNLSLPLLERSDCRWKRDLLPQEIAIFEAHAGDTLHDFGYL